MVTREPAPESTGACGNELLESVLRFEALLVGVAAANILHGEELTDSDFERLALAVRRIDTISSEAL